MQTYRLSPPRHGNAGDERHDTRRMEWTWSSGSFDNDDNTVPQHPATIDEEGSSSRYTSVETQQQHLHPPPGGNIRGRSFSSGNSPSNLQFRGGGSSPQGFGPGLGPRRLQLPLPHSATFGSGVGMGGRDRRGNDSSATWTSSSGDLAGMSDTDEIQDRSEFVGEYNRLAGKYGVRGIVLEGGGESVGSSPSPLVGEEVDKGGVVQPDRSPLQENRPSHSKRSWFSRTFLGRQVSTGSGVTSLSGRLMTTGTEGDEGRGKRMVKHKRSVSDLAMHLVNGVMMRRDSLKDEDLQSLVRLCGKSLLYLPTEYAAGSLVLPTCFRATAQYLVQHAADTQGVFRIPGSVRVVNALYEYYCCAEGDKDDIASTIRCPNLPSHIKVGTHDVASTFKRLLAGLPGGILGSLALFDALVAIHSQLKGDPEFPRTKQTKLRARLIALAVGTVRSQFRRELICAVFGLLCLIGRTAEKTPREDELGRPLPTADLMGYNALGIVFGPLLVGDLIHGYTMRIANPNQGLVLFPVTPPAKRRERRKSKISMDTEASHSRRGALSVDKIHVANSIAEMLIVHWREVVKHMKNLDVLKSSPRAIAEQHARHHYRQQEPSLQEKSGGLRPSASESFVVRKPAEWASGLRNHHSGHFDAGESPVPPSPTPDARRTSGGGPGRHGMARSSLSVQRQRPKTGNARSSSQHRVGAKASMSLLSPTAEEPTLGDPEASPPTVDHDNHDNADEQVYGYPPIPPSGTVQYAAMEEPLSLRQRPPPCAPGESILTSSSTGAGTAGIPCPNTHSLHMNVFEPPMGPSPASPTPAARRRLVVSKDSIRFKDDVTGSIGAKKKRLSQPSPTGGDVLGTTRRRASSATTRKASSTKPTHNEADDYDHLKDMTEMVMVNTGNTGGLQRTKSKAYRVKRPSGSFSSARGKDRSSLDNQARSSQDTARPTVVQGAVSVSSPAQVENKALRDDLPRSDVSGQKRSRLSAWRSKHRGASTDTESPPPQPTSPRFMSFRSRKSLGSESPTAAERRQSRKERSSQTRTTLSSSYDDKISPSDLREKRLSRLENGKKTPLPKTPFMTPQHSPSKSPDKRLAAESTVTTPGTTVQHHLRPVRSVGSAVKAMAAMFESASKEEAFVPTPMQKVGGSIDLKPSGVLAQYTVNPSPKKSSTRSMSPLKTTSPVKQIEMTKSESMGEVERRRTLIPPVVPPRKSRGSTETALWGGGPSPVEFERTTSTGLRSPPTISSTLERDENARPQTSFEAAIERAKATKAVEADNPKKVDKVTGVVSTAQGEDEEMKPATSAPPEREPPARPTSETVTPTPQRKHRVSFSQTTTATRDNDDNDRDSHVIAKEMWSAASRASSLDHPEFPEQQQEEEERSASRQKTQTIALQAQIRSLQMQLVEKSGHTTQLTRELVVKADIGEELEQLKEKLREVERERDMWRERAEKAEERVGMFERVRERVRRAREEAGGEIGGMDGVEEFMEEYYGGEYDQDDMDYRQVGGGESGYNRPAVVIQHHDDTFGQRQGSIPSPGVDQQRKQTQLQQPQQDDLTLHPGWNVQRKPVPSPSPTPSSENQQGPQDESFAERMKRTFKGLPRDVSSPITGIESSRSNAGSPYDMDEDYPGEILPFPPPPPRHRDGGVDNGNGDPGMWEAAEEMFSGVKRQC